MNKTFPVSLKKVEEFIASIKTWCNDTFSTKHTHPYASVDHPHTLSSLGAVGFPDYSDKDPLGILTTYTCKSDCWIGLYNYSDHTVIDVYVNGVFLYKEGGEEVQTAATLIPLRSGDTISTSVAIQYDLYPMR